MIPLLLGTTAGTQPKCGNGKVSDAVTSELGDKQSSHPDKNPASVLWQVSCQVLPTQESGTTAAPWIPKLDIKKNHHHHHHVRYYRQNSIKSEVPVWQMNFASKLQQHLSGCATPLVGDSAAVHRRLQHVTYFTLTHTCLRPCVKHQCVKHQCVKHIQTVC